MNILLVSIACPPKGDPESLQVHKYLSELLRFEDLNISIVTSKNPTLFMDVDEDLNLDTESYDQLIEIPIRESKYVNFVKRKIKPNCLNYPDSKVAFSKSSKKVLRNIWNVPDLIYSRSFPLSSSLLALELKKQYDCPWILHLSDPWILKDSGSISDKWNLQKERECFSLADMICLTSEKTIAFYSKRYPEFTEKLQFYPNVYNQEQIGTPSVPKSNIEKTIITYTGGLTRVRNPESILIAVQNLEQKRPHLSSQLEIRLIGPKDSYCSELIEKYNLSCVKNIGLISYAESLKEQQKADYLLLMDSDIEEPLFTMHFPSKILDYMSQFKPIIALTPKHSTSTDVIKQYNLGSAFDYGSIDKLTLFLDEILSNDNLEPVSDILPEELSATYNANRLYDVFLRYEKK